MRAARRRGMRQAASRSVGLRCGEYFTPRIQRSSLITCRLRERAEKSNSRALANPSQFQPHTTFREASTKSQRSRPRPSTEPVNPAKPHRRTQFDESTHKMSHETVWNSRPRKYGKGARSWYVAARPRCAERWREGGQLTDWVTTQQPRLHPPCRPHPQVRPRYLPPVLQGEGGRHWLCQGENSLCWSKSHEGHWKGE
jgi:hypothetical protein